MKTTFYIYDICWGYIGSWQAKDNQALSLNRFNPDKISKTRKSGKYQVVIRSANREQTIQWSKLKWDNRTNNNLEITTQKTKA